MNSISVIDLIGNDAAAILHNLTTNAVKTLEPSGPPAETFITNLKGKCVGHVLAFRTEHGYRLIGAPGQSGAIAALIDRYTIREDAQPIIADDQWHGWLIVGATELPRTTRIDDEPAYVYPVPWVGESGSGPGSGQLVLIASAAKISGDRLGQSLASLLDRDESLSPIEVLEGERAEAEFHSRRIAAGYPWYGVDVDDSHLPQEVNREPQTISFTKGCYLGQETIARLDALGQVQKKLVRWRLEGIQGGTLPAVDTKLFAGSEKPVGRLTSIAATSADRIGMVGSSDPVVVALGYARRSHFDAGSAASGMLGEREFIATVEGE